MLLALSMQHERILVWRCAIAAGAAALYLGGAALAVDPFDVAFERFHRSETLLWREEGAQTTVAVHERRGIRRCG